MRKHNFPLLAAIAASVTAPMAFAVVDGTVGGGEYASTLALQNTPTGFGDNVSELNAAYANYSAGAALGMALTGNIEANGNSVVIFIDSKPGGGIIAPDGGGFGSVGPQAGFRTDDWNGATLAPNFNPDYSLELSNDGAGYHFNVIDMSLAPEDPNKDIYLGQFDPASGPFATDYYRDAGATLAGNIQHHLDNSNTAGVNGYDFGTPPGPLGDPSTATTGFEFLFDSTFLGHVAGHPVRLMAFIANGGGDYLSNQFLPGLNGAPNLAGPGGDGGGSIFDSRLYGDQFYLTAFVPTTDTSGGGWAGATWSGGAVPDGAEHAAHLTGTTASIISIPSPNGGVTLGYLNLDNPAGWLLENAGGSLFLNGGNGSAVLLASQGNNTIVAPVVVATSTRVAGAANVSFTSGVTIDAGIRLTKGGTGTLSIGGPQTPGAGASIAVDQGALILNTDMGPGLTAADRPDLFVSLPGTNATVTFNASQHLDELHVNDSGVATIAQSGGNITVVTNSSSVDEGKIDLKDNKLVVKGGDVGTYDGNTLSYTGISGEVDRARNTGAWDGNGITTSMSDATSGVLTTLAVARAGDVLNLAPSDTTTWGGQVVEGDDVLVMYTWGGDAQLDGDLDGDDYFQIDSNVAQSGTVFGFDNGDFNYDGLINGDDYFIIDSNIAFAQTQPNWPAGAGAGAAGLAAVPEPAGLSVIALAGAALRRRRRR